jgi:hypothetical protein
VRRRPIAFAFVSVPIDTPLLYADSLADNVLCGVNKYGEGTYTTEGITKLCEALKGSAVTSLKCAAARAFAFLSAPVDMPQLPPLLPCSQDRAKQLWPQGRSRSRRGSQGQHFAARARVRRRALEPLRPSARLSVSAPVDTPTLSPFPSCPSLTASRTTASEPRAPLRSPPSSKRRKSKNSSAPPPLSVRFSVSDH